MNFRLRHYWFKANYDSFHELQEDGSLVNSDFGGVPDFSFNAFNIDFNFNWRFAPGSDIFINWKNSISGYTDSETNDIASWNNDNPFAFYLIRGCELFIIRALSCKHSVLFTTSLELPPGKAKHRRNVRTNDN